MTISLHRASLLILFEAWWIIFMLIAKTFIADTFLGAAYSAISLLLVPGIATLLLIRVRLDLWTYLCIALGLSIIELMLLGLGVNTLLPYFGIERPLDFLVLVSIVSIFVVSLMTAQWLRRESIVFRLKKKYLVFDTVRDWVLILVPCLLVITSIFGANILNNGGSGMVTYISLIGIILISIALLRYTEECDENVVPIALFLIALALLFMTSLRGWYVTGHDIQREFEVFQLTHTSGVWAIERFKDAYNACLSITILPTFLSEFMRVSDQAIFKVLFQICFATVPAMLFVIMRRMVRPTMALIVALYFLAFPTFFSDMPFLNRQEIAFLFLFLMFLVLTDERLSLMLRRTLFMLFGVGMILSHYSTTYTVVALLLFSAVAAPLMRLGGRYFGRFRLFRYSGAAALHTKEGSSRITLLMAVVLAGLSILWSSVLTDTSSNSLARVLVETAQALGANSQEDTRSNDVLYGLFSSRHSDATATLQLYESKVIAPKRAEEPDAYFSESILNKYPIAPAPASRMPLTSLGTALDSIGVDVLGFNTTIRQTSAKVLQILMIIGFGALWVSSAYLKEPLDAEWVALMSGSILMLAFITALPVLSAEYGLLRAFQQSLLFVGLCIVLGSLTLLRRLGERTALAVSGALVILFIISSTGVITQALGGYDAQLHLNNAGASYDLYYMHRGDLKATEWLLEEMRAQGIFAYQSGLAVNVLPLMSPDLTDGVEVLRTIYPSVIRKQSYVVVGNMALNEGRGTLIYNGDVLTYTYPRAFLDENKDLLYNNGTSAVYR